jgi:hypothetical protein
MLEQGTQAPSPAPDLIPAENERQNLTGNSHSDWYSKRGHFKGMIGTVIIIVEIPRRAKK